MPQRYKAPDHTSSISAPDRVIAVGADGLIELADDAPLVEHEYLRRAGCVPVSGKSAPAPVADEPEPVAEAPGEPEIADDAELAGKSRPKV